MIWFQKYKLPVFVVVALGVLYFTTRLYNILDLPIFTDEAIYLRWAQIAKNDASWRFISLTDGKQPMFIWLTMIAMRFIEDPILAGRTVSVFAGFLSMVGLFFLGRELFRNYRIGFIAAGLYVIYPFALVYDRMALYDGLVGTFAVWSLFLTILLVRTLRLDTALLLGMVIGGAALNKTSGFFNLYILPFSLILFDWQGKKRLFRFSKWAGLTLVVAGLTYGFYFILRLSPFSHIIEEKNAIFVYPFSEWIKHPFTFFLSNWKGLWNWFITYMTWPVFFLIVGAFLVNSTSWREKLLLLLWFLVPFTALAFFGNTIYPRFIFFMTLSLLPLVALSLWVLPALIKNKLLLVTCYLLLVALVFRADYFILTDFAHAPIPVSDINQYNNDWPSGTGVREAIDFFRKEAQKQKIYIATQGTFGLMPYALEIYLVDHPNITIKGFWPIEDKAPSEVLEQSGTMPTYFLFYQPCAPCEKKGEAPRSWPLRQVFQVQHVNPGNFLTVYKVEPQ